MKTTSNTAKLANELHEITSREELRRQAEIHLFSTLRKFYGDETDHGFSAEEIEELINETMLGLQARQVDKNIAHSVRNAVLSNVRDTKYWSDIAIRSVTDLAVKGAVIGIGVYAYNKLSSKKVSTGEQVDTGTVADPFSDKHPFAATQRPMRSAKGSNVSTLPAGASQQH